MNNKLFTSVLASFAKFITIFIGAGLVSGSVMYAGDRALMENILILIIGITLFITGLYIQENEKKYISRKDLIPFVFLSLFLALGIGMIIGGMQNLAEFPYHSAFFISAGITLGFFAYVLKEHTYLQLRQWVLLLSGAIIFVPILWFTLRYVNVMLYDSLYYFHSHHYLDHVGEDNSDSEYRMIEIMELSEPKSEQ